MFSQKRVLVLLQRFVDSTVGGVSWTVYASDGRTNEGPLRENNAGFFYDLQNFYSPFTITNAPDTPFTTLPITPGYSRIPRLSGRRERSLATKTINFSHSSIFPNRITQDDSLSFPLDAHRNEDPIRLY